MKTKILGLGLLAAITTAALAVTNASATVSGHFTQDSGGTATITGKETFGTSHRLKFSSDGGTPIECDVAHYSGSVSSATVTTIEVAPSYSQCHTEGAAPGTVTIDANNCRFVFHSRSSETATMGLNCPVGVAGMSITHPNCTMRIPPQQVSGPTYTSFFSFFWLIVSHVHVQNTTTHYEGGICVFLGTTHSGQVNGSITLEALNSSGKQVNFKAT